MRQQFKIIFLAIVICCSTTNVEAQSIATSDKKSPTKQVTTDSILKALIASTKGPASKHAPTAGELASFEGLCKKTLASDLKIEQLKQEWAASGWQLNHVQQLGLMVLTEFPNQRRGRGVYVIRLDSKSNLVLQAPHRFFDQRTGTIVRQIFAEHDVAAAAWNSVHRKQVDLAHQSRHYFNAFMNAIVAARPETVFVQVHGFNGKNKTGNAQSASIIISDATKFPARHARNSAIKLKESFGKDNVKLFPIEVSQLGGTTNSQAQQLRGLGITRFLHLELHAEIRKQLTQNAGLRAQFFHGLVDSKPNSGQ